MYERAENAYLVAAIFYSGRDLMSVVKHIFKLMWRITCIISWPLLMYCLSGFDPQKRGNARKSTSGEGDRRELANWLYWSDMDDRG